MKLMSKETDERIGRFITLFSIMITAATVEKLVRKFLKEQLLDEK